MEKVTKEGFRNQRKEENSSDDKEQSSDEDKVGGNAMKHKMNKRSNKKKALLKRAF
jgi:hypothetical protein